MLKKIINSFLIILGALMFMTFIWLKFIRERLPKDLPFNLSWLGFFILLYICIIYLYIIYNLLFPKKFSNKFIEIVIESIFEPLKRFDQWVKNIPFFHRYYINSIKFLIYQISSTIKNPNILYISLRIMPRFILLSVLFFDIFIFFKLFYIYKIILIGVFIFIFRYIKYSLKYYYENNLQVHKDIIAINMSYEYAIQIVKDTPPEDPEEEDFIPETMNIPLENFINYQTELHLENKELFPYRIFPQINGITYYSKKNNIKIDQMCSEEHQKGLSLWINLTVKELLNLKFILQSLNNTLENKEIKQITLLIYINYFICWIYIIIISCHTLENINIIAIVEKMRKYSILIEPFSQIPL